MSNPRLVVVVDGVHFPLRTTRDIHRISTALHSSPVFSSQTAPLIHSIEDLLTEIHRISHSLAYPSVQLGNPQKPASLILEIVLSSRGRRGIKKDHEGG